MSDSVELVRSFYQSEHNLLGHLDEPVEWLETEGFPYGGTFHGVEEVKRAVFQNLARDWEEFAATPDTILPSGEHVITLGHYSGVYRKTGRRMKAAFAHVYTLSDGKVVRFRQFGDSAKFREAMS